jgi:hypothetical protein
MIESLIDTYIIYIYIYIALDKLYMQLNENTMIDGQSKNLLKKTYIKVKLVKSQYPI